MARLAEFQVRKDKLDETRKIEKDLPALGNGQILAKVDRFAVTANNVTYGVVGERIGYWKFFPVEEEGWGVIPVWGFADVEASNHSDVAVGERLYGYWPMASHLIMTPGKVSEHRLTDDTEHRRELPPVYNSYVRVSNEQGYDPKTDNDRMVLMPLYATSFCIYDFLKDNDWFGADRIIVGSGSSKTAIGTAYAIKSDASPPALTGLTSARNKETVERLRLYDEVVEYDQIEKLDRNTPTVIIDMSGDGGVLGRLHKLLGDNMKYTSNVGVTHFEANEMGPDFNRDRSAMFFAPGHIQKRAKDWGPGEFEKRAHKFWSEASQKSRSWLTIQEARGVDAIDHAWREVLGGKTPASAAWAVGF